MEVEDAGLNAFMKLFCDTLQKRDATKAELERERLDLAKRQMEVDLKIFEEERDERRREEKNFQEKRE